MMQDPVVVFPTYAIMAVTGPVMGAACGSILITKLGGYEETRSLLALAVLGTLGAVAAIPIPFLTNFPIFIGCTWIYMFFGGAVMPSMTGVMISSVYKGWRPLANSFAQVIINLLGYLPAPFIYGLICSLTGGQHSPYGMAVILYSSLLGMLFCGLAYKDKKEKEN
jgi:MFS family permease